MTKLLIPTLQDIVAVTGQVEIELRDERGKLKHYELTHNLITDAGDLYNAGKVIAGIAPASPSAPTAASGMKLGTGTAAVGKNTAGHVLGAYISASNLAFDATYPQTENLGAGLGVNAVYKTTWGPGVATNAAITEAIIANDAATNATSTGANTYGRLVFTLINKVAGDTLAITWKWKFLGV